MLAQLPWTPKPEATPRQRKLTKERRNAIVERTAALMRTGDPTPFAYEGSARHALRVGLILEGWGWQLADLAAAEIVRIALDRVGARRPLWWEAQGDYAQGALMLCEHCLTCGEPVLSGIHARFCSPVCTAKWQRRVGAFYRREGDAYARAVRTTRGLDEQHNI